MQTKNVEFETVDYLKNPLTELELADLLMKLNKNPQDIIRTKESLYKSDFKGKKFTNEEWIKILVDNPKLIERPIIVKNYKAVIGRPVDEIDRLF